MSELLERVCAETRERLEELRPLVAEYERLEAALVALEGAAPRRGESSGAAASPAARPTGASSRRSATPAPRRPDTGGSNGRGSGNDGQRSRAPRGANRAAVLAAVRERPGASAAELAAAAGLSRPVAYTLLNRLSERGELVRSELPSGKNGYAVPPEPPAAGWSSGDGGAEMGAEQDGTPRSGTEPTSA